MKSNSKISKSLPGDSGNRLFPVFLKLDQLRILIVGGGPVALEKLTALIRQDSDVQVRMIALKFDLRIQKLAHRHANIILHTKAFESRDLKDADLVMTAVNDVATSRRIGLAAKRQRLLVNAADKPTLCDFYLGSIVQKGNLKIGISTNGKSPTLAKRLKEVLNEVLPAEMNDVLKNMEAIRMQLKGDLPEKIRQLNHITSMLIDEPAGKKSRLTKKKK